jgi:hypothetical protein
VCIIIIIAVSRERNWDLYLRLLRNTKAELCLWFFGDSTQGEGRFEAHAGAEGCYADIANCLLVGNQESNRF